MPLSRFLRWRRLLHRASVRLSVLLPGAALLLSACSGGEEDWAEEPRYERLTFEGRPLDTETAWSVEVEILGELTPTGPGLDWILEAPERSGIRGVKGRPSARIEGMGGERLVRIPLRERERDFNSVIVELAALPKGAVKKAEVGPYKGGIPLVPPQVVEIAGGRDWTTRSLSFKRLAGLGEKPDEVRVRFTGGGKVGVVSRITLARSPLHAEIDMSAEASRSWPMVAIGAVHRRIAHVTTDSVARSTFEIGRGDRVEIFVGVDPTYAVDGERLTFQCDLTVGSLTSPREVTVKRGKWKRVLWKPDRDMVGEARLEVTTTSTRQAGIGVGVIGDASVSHPGRNAPLALLITSDTHRADHISIVDDQSIVRTPHLDDLARTGVLFEDCFSQTNVTNPSHISLMTGLHPRDTGIVDNRKRLARRAETIAEAYAAAGYRTFATTSAFHLQDNHSGLGQGFDRMEGPISLERDGEISIEILMDWIEESDGLPVFAWLHLFDAHEPYGPPEPFDKRYYEGDDPFAGDDPDIDPKLIPEWLTGLKDLDYPYAQYRAEVDYLDGALCELLEHDRVATGLVAFTADHGESFGQHGIWWNHAGLYPDTVHIPLIMRWPGGPAGVNVSGAVRQSDIAATMLAISDIDRGEIPGEDLRGTIDDELKIDARYMLGSHFMNAAVQVGKYLFVMDLRPHFERSNEALRHTGASELYDISVDPDCENDLLLEEFDVARTLRERLIEWLESSEDLSLSESQERTSNDEAMLEGLGYASSNTATSTSWWDPQRWAHGGWKNSPWNHLFSQDGYDLDSFRGAVVTWKDGLR